MFVSIGFAARFLGVAVITLRRWEAVGKIGVSFRTPGGHRRYDLDIIRKIVGIESPPDDQKIVVGYARVSSHDQKDDLARQSERLANHLKNEPNSVVISDLGSGLNFKKRGLNSLILMILQGRVRRLIITNKDRLLRFGFELIEKLISYFGGEICVLDASKTTDEEELSRDVLSIITVFSARLYGKRSHKNKNILKNN